MSIDRAALAESLKLRAYLREIPESALLAICKFWAISPSVSNPSAESFGQHELPDTMYPRMLSEQYFAATLNRLVESEKQVVQFLTLHGGELAQSEISERLFRGNHKSADKAIESLREKGFLFPSDELPESLDAGDSWIALPDAFAKMIEFPPHWVGFMGSLLQNVAGEHLGAIAKRVLGTEDVSLLTATELRYSIRKRLLNPEVLKDYLQTLSASERQVFDDIMDRKGFSLYRDLLDATSTRKYDHNRADELNSLLQTSGLLYTVAEGQNKYMNSLMAPRDMVYIIQKKFQPDTRSLQKIDSVSGPRRDGRPSSVTDNTQNLLRDTAVLAGRLDAQKPKKLADGGISRTELKKAAAIFPASRGNRYAVMLSLFLLGERLLIEVNDNYKAADSAPPRFSDSETIYLSMFRWWVKSTDWNELFVEGVTVPGDKPPQLWTDIVELRQEILKALTKTAKERWITFAAFWDTISPQLDANLSRGAGGGGYGGVLTVKDAVAAMLRDSLTWLGIIYLGSHNDNDSSSVRLRRAVALRSRGESAAEVNQNFSFQLSPLGKLLCGSKAAELSFDGSGDNPVANQFPQLAEWIFVQPNLEVVAPPDLNLKHLFHLARLAEVKNLDVMTTFEITRESLRVAVERGGDGQDIIAFLAQLSRTDLPDTVRQLVTECTTKKGELRLGSCGGYLICEDAYVLESIIRHQRFGPQVKERVGDEVLLLASESDLNKLAKDLRTHGHSLKVERGTVHSSTDGRFHLSLSELEMQDLVAAARLLDYLENLFETDLSDGRAGSLAQRLRPDSTGFLISERNVETRSRQVQKRFEAAFNDYTEKISERYKNQVGRLVSKSTAFRGPSKYHYKGVNPATDRSDITDLIQFAREYELEVELLYVRQNEQEVRVVVLPKGVEGERIYAHNPATDTDAIYSLPRIMNAKLL